MVLAATIPTVGLHERDVEVSLFLLLIGGRHGGAELRRCDQVGYRWLWLAYVPACMPFDIILLHGSKGGARFAANFHRFQRYA
jgi:hypothetical protein